VGANKNSVPEGVEVAGPAVDGLDRVLTGGALEFLATLERRFRAEREARLGARAERQADIDAGAGLGLLPKTAALRHDPEWRIAETPPDLLDRRVEITGPAEPKMIINALNSGARCFMADFEDALSPTWPNVVGGQAALMDAVRGRLELRTPEKTYRLGDRVAQLLVRPRGWHLPEAHLRVDGAPMSASLFDAGLYLFHNAAERLARGTGPYLYLPKLQSHLEARLWNDVFVWAQDALGIPRGSVRATVLIETLPAAFEMEEILYELRDHSAGLNAGRWDYLFSTIKTFRARRDLLLPDRGSITMTVPFMRAYTDRLVLTCHRRGAPAMGGMAAFIPNRRDEAVTDTALRKVREDKERESRDGFDGTWVAHPDLVPLATEVFDTVLAGRPNQHDARRAEAPLGREVPGDPAALLDLRVDEGRVTDAGVRLNVNVGLQYLDAWLGGNGAAAIHNLMEDAATAEISRSQLWQWRVNGAKLDDGSTFDDARYLATRSEELALLGGRATRHLADAADLLDRLVRDDTFADFLTLGAYPLL
jgi:malate synthase